MQIPLSKPFWGREEEQAVTAALRTTTGTGDGLFGQKMSKMIGSMCRSKFVYPVTSGTHGLELAMMTLGDLPRVNQQRIRGYHDDRPKNIETYIPSFVIYHS